VNASGLGRSELGDDAVARAWHSFSTHGKSFAFAARWLEPRVAAEAAVVYAWCRAADDAVDRAPVAERRGALRRLEAELESIYTGEPQADPVLEGFQVLVKTKKIPREYPGELLAGMGMDVEGRVYERLDELYGYAFRVASTVGLMMCHVFGIREDSALREAAHMGIAMQLTNIARDVLDDWANDRVYLPKELLRAQGLENLAERLGAPFPQDARAGVARATAELLDIAEGFYASGDRGVTALPRRAEAAVRVARSVYSAIGDRVAARGFDPVGPRAFVPILGKAGLAAWALAPMLTGLGRRTNERLPETVCHFPADLEPWPEPSRSFRARLATQRSPQHDMGP
jgi:phytoene synthase